MKKILIISAIAILLISAAFIIIFVLHDSDSIFTFGAPENLYTKSPLNEATLTFHQIGEEPSCLREILDEIQKQTSGTLNIKLDFKFHTWEKMNDEVKTIIASDSPCDAFYLYNTFAYQDSCQSYARNGLLKDITELFPRYAAAYYNMFKAEELSAAMVDGKLVALPARNENYYRPCAIVRTDLMENYEIPDIKNYDDFEVYLKTVKENEPDLFPLASYGSAVRYFATINGYAIYDESLGLVYKWDDNSIKMQAWEQTADFRQSLDTINSWIKNGYLSTDIPIMYPDDTIVTNKKFASFIGFQGTAEYYNSALKKNGINAYRYIEFPLFPTLTVQRADPMQEIIAFGAKSENTERTLMFIDWIESKQENYDLFMYGIKGKNYNLVGEQVDIPAGLETGNSYNYWMWRWPLVNSKFERLVSGSSEEYHAAYLDVYKNQGKFPSLSGFMIDRSGMGDVFSERMEKYYLFEQALRKGELTVEQAAGYFGGSTRTNNFIMDIQTQINAWNASRQ